MSPLDFMQLDLAARDRRIAQLETKLETANREIGAQGWTITDLKRRLVAAEEAVSELRAMNERGRECA